MASLNLRRRGGDLTGSSVGFSEEAPPDLGPELSASQISSMERAVAPEISGIEALQAGSDVSIGQFLKESIMAGGIRARARQKAAVAAARAKRDAETNDMFFKGLDAVFEAKDDPQMQFKIGQAMTKKLLRRDPEEAAIFADIVDEPAIVDFVKSPIAERAYGSTDAAVKSYLQDKDSFWQDVVNVNTASITEKLQDFKLTDPKGVQLDADENGTITLSEAQRWVSKHFKKGDTGLTAGEMSVILRPEFADALTDVFDAVQPESVRKKQEQKSTAKQALSARLPNNQVVPANFDPESGIRTISLDGGTTFQSAPKGTQFFKRSAQGTLEQIGAEGFQGLTKAQTNKVQEELRGLRTQLKDLDKVGEKFAKEFLTAKGKTKGFIGRGLDFMSGLGGEAINDIIKITSDIFGDEVDLIEFGSDQEDFLGDVEAFFQAYRKYITGAQAAFAEFALLKKAVISGDLAPTSFVKRFNTLMKRTQRDIADKENLLREGIDIRATDEDRRLANEFDATFGAQSGLTPEQKRFIDALNQESSLTKEQKAFLEKLDNANF